MKVFLFLVACCLPSFLQAQERSGTLDLLQVYQAAPWIYCILLIMSIASLAVWLYSLISWRISDMMPKEFIHQMRQMISEKRFEAATCICQQEENFSSGIISAGLAARKHGPQMMMETMQIEGKRSANSLWQRISFLNEIAFIAPMIGLLGTVLGLFFAFYDTGQTAESLTTIFDGLGIAIGTTVAGLIVAILAMIFASILKFRIVSLLNRIESELLSLVSLTE